MKQEYDISDLFYQEGKKEEKEFPFPALAATEEPVNAPVVSLSLENTGKGKARLEGSSCPEFVLSCDRCLSPVRVSIPLSFSRDMLAPELLEDEDSRSEQQFMDGCKLDLAALVGEELRLSWPGKVLCREDCKGLCPKCGQNLNEKNCGCDDFVPDIRFAGLMDLFNDSNPKT
jgi:uncharacterized protein